MATTTADVPAPRERDETVGARIVRFLSKGPVYALLIFIGLLFWSWVWGFWGAILAVPMMVVIKAICDHVEDLRPVGELLGD